MNAMEVLGKLGKYRVLVIMQGKTVVVLHPSDQADQITQLLREYTPGDEDPVIASAVAELSYLTPLIMASRELQQEIITGLKVTLDRAGVTLHTVGDKPSLTRLKEALGQSAVLKSHTPRHFPGDGTIQVAQLTVQSQEDFLKTALSATAALAEASSETSVKEILTSTLRPHLEQDVEVTVTQMEPTSPTPSTQPDAAVGAPRMTRLNAETSSASEED